MTFHYENIKNLSTSLMYTSPKLLMLLLNLYFNLSLFQPSLLHIFSYETTKATFGTSSEEGTKKIPTEVKIDNLLADYKRKLQELSTIQDDRQAISQMNKARQMFMERAQMIKVELETQTNKLSPKQVSLLKEKQLLNPLFRQINDATWAYMRTGRLEANVALKNSFLAMDDFMEVIFK